MLVLTWICICNVASIQHFHYVPTEWLTGLRDWNFRESTISPSDPSHSHIWIFWSASLGIGTQRPRWPSQDPGPMRNLCYWYNLIRSRDRILLLNQPFWLSSGQIQTIMRTRDIVWSNPNGNLSEISDLIRHASPSSLCPSYPINTFQSLSRSKQYARSHSETSPSRLTANPNLCYVRERHFLRILFLCTL